MKNYRILILALKASNGDPREEYLLDYYLQIASLSHKFKLLFPSTLSSRLWKLQTGAIKNTVKHSPFSYTGSQEVVVLRKKKTPTITVLSLPQKQTKTSILFGGFGLVWFRGFVCFVFLLAFWMTQSFVFNTETEHSERHWQLWKTQHSIKPQKKNNTISSNMYSLTQPSPNVL